MKKDDLTNFLVFIFSFLLKNFYKYNMKNERVNIELYIFKNIFLKTNIVMVLESIKFAKNDEERFLRRLQYY